MTEFESTHLRELATPRLLGHNVLCCDPHVISENAVRSSLSVSESE
jgi:hypothetical protein